MLSAALSDLVNVEEEKARLEKEVIRLQKEILRGEKMLSNPGFTGKAPASKVEAEKKKLDKYRTEFALVNKQLSDIDKIQSKK